MDTSYTSDEYLYNIAKRKKAIIDSLLDIMKKASVDCTLHAKQHGIKCFSFPVNMNENIISRQYDIKDEELDTYTTRNIEQNMWEGQLLRTKKGNFVIKNGTNEVYDYDIYIDSGKVVRIGTLILDGDTRRINIIE